MKKLILFLIISLLCFNNVTPINAKTKSEDKKFSTVILSIIEDSKKIISMLIDEISIS